MNTTIQNITIGQLLEIKKRFPNTIKVKEAIEESRKLKKELNISEPETLDLINLSRRFNASMPRSSHLKSNNSRN